MSDDSFENDVLRELEDGDRLGEIAGLLGTDPDGARETVRTTVGSLTGGLAAKADTDDDEGQEVRAAFAEVSDPPLQGAATLGGGMLSGGLMAGVLAKAAKPVAAAVAKRTGIPAATVTRVIEVLIPVILAVFAKRAAAGKGGVPGAGPVPGGAASTPGAGGGLADLLGKILGGGKK
ncbi:DUF937 domain-containing protein [Streptomyces sp. BI20]|uniref:DUF937 domain-containing protein n=1 Tax=Streptomyces sp. BI20 TaxID=3403460 RepID=UPI003C776740